NCVVYFNSVSYIPSEEEKQLLKLLDEMKIIDNIEDQGKIYVAEYISYRFKNKFSKMSDWLQFISRGKCMYVYPSSDLLKVACIMNTELSKFNDSKLNNFIFQKVTDKVHMALKPIELPGEVVSYFVRTRTDIKV
ncbi:hypothetical protein ALC62_12732, partial [Cyphomyrmex costatus]